MFQEDVTGFWGGLEEVSCRPHAGPVKLYQWRWLVKDSSEYSYVVSTARHVCINSDDPDDVPMCPENICGDIECQVCQGFQRPAAILPVDEEVISKVFDLELAQKDPVTP